MGLLREVGGNIPSVPMFVPMFLIDGAQMVDPTGPDENMPWNFSIPKEPVPSGLDTYSGPSDSSGGLDW